MCPKQTLSSMMRKTNRKKNMVIVFWTVNIFYVVATYPPSPS